MDNQIMTIQNVHCYLDDSGTAWLNAEDVARGLGFVDYQEKDSATSGRKTYEVIRWARVNRYLAEFGFPNKLGKDSFIPENIFYRLAMKASNAAAEKFQALVADEILPSIRKHGAYLTVQAAEQILTNPDFIIKLAEQVKQAQMERDQFKALADARQETINEMQPKADYCDKVLQGDELFNVRFIAKEYGVSASEFNQLLHKLKIQYKSGKHWLLYQEYANKGYMEPRTVTLANGLPVTHYYWTPTGRMFLYSALREVGILTTRERNENSCDGLFAVSMS